MSRTLSVEHEGQTYIWDGRTWFNARDYTVPHQALINVLDQLGAGAKRTLEGDLALERLVTQVNAFLEARGRGDLAAVREVILQLYDTVDGLREAHSSKPLSQGIVEGIRKSVRKQ